jgi:putative DNA primase/helicase
LDVSGALASRFLIISLKESFFGREQLDLKDKLLAERPGILNWALKGLVRLKKRGYFQVPESSLEAVRQLEDLSSPVTAFVRECCALDPNAKTKKQVLYGEYQDWCQETGQLAMAANVFGKDLTAAFAAEVRASHSNSVAYYRGIKLK